MVHVTLKAAILAVSILGVAQPAVAKEVEAAAMKYTNDGAYTAQFYIRYNLDDGTKCRVRPKGFGSANIYSAGSVTYQLTDTMLVFDGGDACLNSGGDIPEGLQVWGRVEISNGTNESCKKDKKVIYKLSGGTVKYKTKGTTLNNNRCRVSSWP
jgi:hypothetical protein